MKLREIKMYFTSIEKLQKRISEIEEEMNKELTADQRLELIDELFDILKTCIRKGPKTKEFREYVRTSAGLIIMETVTSQKVRD